MKTHLTALFCTLMLFGCAQLGVPAADTFNKKLYEGYATVAYVAQSAQQLRISGHLSDADRANVVASSQAAVNGLDLAASMHATACPAAQPAAAGNPACTAPAANAKLSATLLVLQALQTYLNTQGAK